LSVEVLLSLGSNLGDRKALIDTAVSRLDGLVGTAISARSSYYRTAPVGPVEQEWFLNIAVALMTELRRDDLVAACKQIERDLGRDRTKEISWGPRPIDIDVVLYDGQGKLDERAFALVPMAEIATSLSARAAMTDASGVEKLDWPVPPV
jgi:2-amino-4-hydroxy-6-hydroxymethyldihydropteridine diphosphokinase